MSSLFPSSPVWPGHTQSSCCLWWNLSWQQPPTAGGEQLGLSNISEKPQELARLALLPECQLHWGSHSCWGSWPQTWLPQIEFFCDSEECHSAHPQAMPRDPRQNTYMTWIRKYNVSYTVEIQVSVLWVYWAKKQTKQAHLTMPSCSGPIPAQKS